MVFHKHDVDGLAEHGDQSLAHLSHPRKLRCSGGGQEMTKSHPRALGAARLVMSMQERTHTLGPHQPQCSRSADATQGRQETPTLNDNTATRNLALKSRDWLPSFCYPGNILFPPFKYSPEFFLVSTVNPTSPTASFASSLLYQLS